MIKADEYYLSNLKEIGLNGCFDHNPRTKWEDGTQAFSKFITHVFESYDIAKGEFPITTLRNTAIKTGIKEILWIYQKQTSSLEEAHQMGITWWDKFDIGDNTIGNRYGDTISKYKLMDNLLNSLKNDPFSRRHVMNMYQEDQHNKSKGLYECAYETIWSVRVFENEMYLDMVLNQRSNDYIVAGYINKIQYVALQMMVAASLGYKVGKFSHLVTNLHIYDRHMGAIQELLDREPLIENPRIELKCVRDFYDYTVDDFVIIGVENIKKINTKLELAI